jgi:hypothetical protein
MCARSILSEVGPRLEALAIDLMRQGAEQRAVLYLIEKELSASGAPTPAGSLRD